MKKLIPLTLIIILFSGCKKEEIDTTPPVISLIGESVMTLPLGSIFDDPGVIVKDETNTNLTYTNTHNIDPEKIGSYTVTYNAVDSSGNKATPITRTVNYDAMLLQGSYSATYSGFSAVTTHVSHNSNNFNELKISSLWGPIPIANEAFENVIINIEHNNFTFNGEYSFISTFYGGSTYTIVATGGNIEYKYELINGVYKWTISKMTYSVKEHIHNTQEDNYYQLEFIFVRN